MQNLHFIEGYRLRRYTPSITPMSLGYQHASFDSHPPRRPRRPTALDSATQPRTAPDSPRQPQTQQPRRDPCAELRDPGDPRRAQGSQGRPKQGSPTGMHAKGGLRGQGRPRASLGEAHRAQRRPRESQGIPRGAKGRPRETPRKPKGNPVAPKGGPKATQRKPGSIEEAPREAQGRPRGA